MLNSWPKNNGEANGIPQEEMLVFYGTPALPNIVRKESSQLPSGEEGGISLFHFICFELLLKIIFSHAIYFDQGFSSPTPPWSSYYSTYPTPCLFSLSLFRKQTRWPTKNELNGIFLTFCLISLYMEEELGLKKTRK